MSNGLNKKVFVFLYKIYVFKNKIDIKKQLCYIVLVNVNK